MPVERAEARRRPARACARGTVDNAAGGAGGPRLRGMASTRRSDGSNAGGGILSQPVRGRDARRVRGLGGDVPVLRVLRRGASRGGRAALLVLELDALPGADARVRRDLHRHCLPGARNVAEPGLRRAARDGHRLALSQRLHLHLRQSRHRPGEDRRAGRVLPAARRVLLRELGRPLREMAHEDGGADRGARRGRGTAAPRVRARRGRLRGSGDELLRRSRRVPDSAAARRSDVAEPFRVPAARLRRLHDVLRALQGQPPGHP